MYCSLFKRMIFNSFMKTSEVIDLLDSPVCIGADNDPVSTSGSESKYEVLPLNYR